MPSRTLYKKRGLLRSPKELVRWFDSVKNWKNDPKMRSFREQFTMISGNVDSDWSLFRAKMRGDVTLMPDEAKFVMDFTGLTRDNENPFLEVWEHKLIFCKLLDWFNQNHLSMEKPKPRTQIHNSRLSMCASHAKNILKNGGGKNNPNNFWYIIQIKNHCKELGIDVLEVIDLDSLTPQLTTADVPLTAGAIGTDLTEVKETVPPLVEPKISVTKIAQETAVSPLPIIQISGANICKLDTCSKKFEIMYEGQKYCSRACKIKFNNKNRSTKSA